MLSEKSYDSNLAKYWGLAIVIFLLPLLPGCKDKEEIKNKIPSMDFHIAEIECIEGTPISANYQKSVNQICDAPIQSIAPYLFDERNTLPLTSVDDSTSYTIGSLIHFVILSRLYWSKEKKNGYMLYIPDELRDRRKCASWLADFDYDNERLVADMKIRKEKKRLQVEKDRIEIRRRNREIVKQREGK